MGDSDPAYGAFALDVDANEVMVTDERFAHPRTDGRPLKDPVEGT